MSGITPYYRVTNHHIAHPVFHIHCCICLAFHCILRTILWIISNIEDIHDCVASCYKMRRSVNMSVSKDMLNTLFSIKNGKEYLLRGDKWVGLEIRCDKDRRQRKEVNCRSLSPLMRDGLIDFTYLPTDMTRYYRVRLTEDGEKFIRDNLKCN